MMWIILIFAAVLFALLLIIIKLLNKVDELQKYYHDIEFSKMMHTIDDRRGSDNG